MAVCCLKPNARTCTLFEMHVTSMSVWLLNTENIPLYVRAWWTSNHLYFSLVGAPGSQTVPPPAGLWTQLPWQQRGQTEPCAGQSAHTRTHTDTQPKCCFVRICILLSLWLLQLCLHQPATSTTLCDIGAYFSFPFLSFCLCLPLFLWVRVCVIVSVSVSVCVNEVFVAIG